MLVDICPAGVTTAAPDRVWEVLIAPERFGDWTDATYISADPAGPATPGQVVHLGARGLGRVWPLTIDIGQMDPERRWIDMIVRLPFEIRVDEHITLTPTPEGGTLVRFN